MGAGVNRNISQAPDDELMFYLDFEFAEMSQPIRDELRVFFNIQKHDDDATHVKKALMFDRTFKDWVGRTIVRKDEAYLRAHLFDPFVRSRWELDSVTASLHLVFNTRDAAMLFKLAYC